MCYGLEEGWTRGTGSQIPFLLLSPTSPMTLDKFQGHQIFRQLLLQFGPRLTQAEPSVAECRLGWRAKAWSAPWFLTHHQGCLSATPFPVNFSEVPGREGDDSHLCISPGAGVKSFSSRMPWRYPRREVTKKTLLRNQTKALCVCTEPGQRVDS